jgi:hypothetical protein
MVATKKTRRSLETLTPEQRELVADNMRERIYSSITLIAVLTVMWQNDEHRSVLGTIAVILGSVVALWLATLISARMSYRAVHGKSIKSSDYRKTFFTTSGLLAPALLPTAIILVSGLTHWYTIKTALMASIIISLLSLFGLSFQAGRKIYDSLGRLLLVSALEMSVGLLVILLKLAVGE